MSHPTGFTLWLTGLPGAGKSTLARAVAAELQRRGHRAEILDGDEIRTNLSKELGFSKEDRETHVRRVSYVARLLARNGVPAIAAAISPYRNVRDDIRRTHEAPFVEVYVECPLDELVRRDPKGLYAKALRGEIPHFTGVSDPYEAPISPEVHIRSDQEPVERSAGRILEWLEQRGLITSRAGRT